VHYEGGREGGREGKDMMILLKALMVLIAATSAVLHISRAQCTWREGGREGGREEGGRERVKFTNECVRSYFIPFIVAFPLSSFPDLDYQRRKKQITQST